MKLLHNFFTWAYSHLLMSLSWTLALYQECIDENKYKKQYLLFHRGIRTNVHVRPLPWYTVYFYLFCQLNSWLTLWTRFLTNFCIFEDPSPARSWLWRLSSACCSAAVAGAPSQNAETCISRKRHEICNNVMIISISSSSLASDEK